MYINQDNGKRRVHTFIQQGILAGTAGLMTLVLAVNLTGCLQQEPRQTSEPIATLSADTEAPKILGVKDLTVPLGGTVSYREGITLTDNEDSDPVLSVDSSRVDLTREGTYTVTYTATDVSGNTATASAAVTVTAPESTEADTISLAAQEVLDAILTDGMTVREQCRAIYDWARENITYGGHSDRTDWRQTGYDMLINRKGDCYGYFAATKLLFEELGIDNIDVQKVKRSADDSEHYWSLVSPDGGTTWYHFDATPRVGQTEDLCLVTDTFLASFDTYHDDCHNRDKSLYPATPEGWV
ncbi:MAG: transglutaminase domain-containing protein [Oscillospiraceae bacterium]|nr:transglutaminase domain-containing protein [Oscillospiraceae bacterium]MBQ8835763.1 transglutaminase domain-containing protein [Oscillospiraceae bacterium]